MIITLDQSNVATYSASMAKTTFMKVRVTKEEQAEWMRICASIGEDFSAIVRKAMKRRASMDKTLGSGAKDERDSKK